MPQVLAIPQAQLVVLTVLRKLGPEGVGRLTQIIEDQRVLLHAHELKRAISPLLGDEAELVAEVLTGLSYMQRTGLHVEEVLDRLTETLQARSHELEPRWDPVDFEHWSTLRGPLMALLTAEPLLTVGKAIDLEFAHANILYDVQVVTDVRPVFDSKGDTPLAAVISHTLCLRYRDDRKAERLVLALDHDDLGELIKACQRAMEKEKSLKFMLSPLLRTEIAGCEGEDEVGDGAS
jgi:hypothetical protein